MGDEHSHKNGLAPVNLCFWQAIWMKIILENSCGLVTFQEIKVFWWKPVVVNPVCHWSHLLVHWNTCENTGTVSCTWTRNMYIMGNFDIILHRKVEWLQRPYILYII